MQLQKITDAYSHATIILLNTRISKSFFLFWLSCIYKIYIYICIFSFRVPHIQQLFKFFFKYCTYKIS